MPIEQVWSLVLVFAGIAFLAIFDDVRTRLTLKQSNEVIADLRKNLDVTARENKEGISSLKETHLQEIEALKKEVKKLSIAPWQVEHRGPINID